MKCRWMVLHANGTRWVLGYPTDMVAVGAWPTSARAASRAFGKWGPASNGYTRQWEVRPIEIAEEVA